MTTTTTTDTISGIVEEYAFPTDKTCGPPFGHTYGPTYDRLLAPYRERPIRLLEIGVFGGGSLRLWKTFFEQGEVVGVDIAPLVDAFELEGIATLVKADAYKPKVAATLGEFDIVIDDGPHTLDSMKAAIRLYLPRLKPGGLMVIEDVKQPEWIAELEAVVPAGCPCESIDLTVPGGLSDDRLFVVRTPEFAAP
jgi:demethylmacrocin O-methyltransferase